MPTPFPTLQIGDADYSVGPAVGMRDGYAIVIVRNGLTGDWEAVLVKDRGTSLEEADRIALPTPGGQTYYEVWDIVRLDSTYAAVLCHERAPAFGGGSWALVLERSGDTLTAGSPLTLDSTAHVYQNLVGLTSTELILSWDGYPALTVEFRKLTRSGTTLSTSGLSSSFSHAAGENVVPCGVCKIANDAEVYSYYRWTTGLGRFCARIVDLGDPPTVGSEIDICGVDVDGIPNGLVGLIGKAGTQVADQVAVVGLNAYFEFFTNPGSHRGTITRTGPATGSAMCWTFYDQEDGGGTWDFPYPQGALPLYIISDDSYYFLVNGQYLFSSPGYDRIVARQPDSSTSDADTLGIDPPVDFNFTPSGVLTEGASAFVFWPDVNGDLWVGLLIPFIEDIAPLRIKQRDDELQWHGGIRIPLGNRPTSRQRGIRIPGPNTYT